MNHSYQNRTALITGATGGIGSALAKKMAAQSVSLILHYHSALDAAEKLAEECRTLGAARVKITAADFSDAQSVDDFLQQKFLQRSSIYFLAIASGIDLMSTELKSLSFEERLARAIEIDLVTPMRIARKIGNEMKLARGGSIVFISWDGILYGGSGETAQLYGAVKGGISGFAKSLAHSLAPAVRVNTLLPGWIKTRWGNEVAANTTHNFHAAGMRDSLLSRWGESEEVAAAAWFLLSDEARYINSTSLELNGGKIFAR